MQASALYREEKGKELMQVLAGNTYEHYEDHLPQVKALIASQGQDWLPHSLK